MIDFTNCKLLNKGYSGANGNKLSIIYNDKIYMLKFPSLAKNNPNLSYTNSTVSEYLGCHIFNMIGLKAQNTILGTYKYKGKEKIVVACEDFTSDDEVFQDFASLKNQIIESSSNGYGTELNDVLNTIKEQNSINNEKLTNFFWEMFVIDAFVGNWDRHNGNWGFLYNRKEDKIRIAPIFDLGSSLYPQLDEESIINILNSKTELKNRVMNFPLSALLENNKKINYYFFIMSHKYKECDDAIKRIISKIDLDKINKLIDDLDCISKKRKLFLKKILKMRKEIILDASLN